MVRYGGVLATAAIALIGTACYKTPQQDPRVLQRIAELEERADFKAKTADARLFYELVLDQPDRITVAQCLNSGLLYGNNPVVIAREVRESDAEFGGLVEIISAHRVTSENREPVCRPSQLGASAATH